MTDLDRIDLSTEDLETLDHSIACSSCYTGEAYAKPGAACAWCSAPRGVCGGCGAGSSELRLCAECGLHEESVHELARDIHLITRGGEDLPGLSPGKRAEISRLVSGGYRPATTVEATRSVVIRHVVQWGVDALERELGLAEPENVPPELQARIAAVAERSPDVLEQVARRARALAPPPATLPDAPQGSGVEEFPARLADVKPPDVAEIQAQHLTALEHGLRVLEQELGIIP